MAQSPAPVATEAAMDPNLDAEPQHSPPANDLKRRQSEVSKQESKRLRTSPGKISSLPDPSPARDSPREESSRRDSSDKTAEKQPTRPGDATRKSSKINEKDRSRRLFGGLLGSLSQKDDSRTTKRRQEIESRRKAELQRQDDEHVEDKQKRLEQLAGKRRRVKKEIEDETRRNRHRNMLHRANFLQTTAQPRLLYKPWELRDDEEDRIDDQISRAKAQIEQELAGSETTLTPRTGGEENPSTNTNTQAEEKTPQADDTANANLATSEPPHTGDQPTEDSANATSDQDGHASTSKEAIPAAEPTSSHANEPASVTGSTAEETQENPTTTHDDQDDHVDVVEGEEDTVIY